MTKTDTDHRVDPDRDAEELSRIERSLESMRSGFAAVGRGGRRLGRGTTSSTKALRRAGSSGARRTGSVLDWTRRRAEPVWRHVRPVFAAVTGLGWAMLAVAALAWVGGALLGWVELLIVAAALLIVFVLCALLTIGRTRLSVTVEVSPQRVVAGNPSAGRLRTSNASRGRLLPIMLEVPIGVSRAVFHLRRLRHAEVQEELFALETTRRGVVPIGPATTVRGDPFGLLRRTLPWTDVIELIVHPITVPLNSLGAGVLRDLEGQTTQDTSTSDLAFHTLREYAPGDDRRYIHWRSSARATAVTGESTLLVRQFLDTRRSHLCAVVDGRSDSYMDDIDFETAISVAASVVRRAYADEVDTTVLAGDRIIDSGSLPLTMDAFSRAVMGGDMLLSTRAARASQLAPDTTIALLVTGANTEFGELRRAANHFAPEVNVVAVRVDPTKPVGLTGLTRLTVLSLPQLSGLRTVLGGADVA